MRVIYCPNCSWVFPGDATKVGLPPRCQECGQPLSMITSEFRRTIVNQLLSVGIPLPEFVGSMRMIEDEPE